MPCHPGCGDGDDTGQRRIVALSAAMVETLLEERPTVRLGFQLKIEPYFLSRV